MKFLKRPTEVVEDVKAHVLLVFLFDRISGGFERFEFAHFGKGH